MEARFRFASVLSITLLAACQAQAPRPRPDVAIRAALGPNAPVVLLLEGLPIEGAGTDAGRLGLDEALERGLENSPEIQAALARVRSALADADQARLLENPLLEFVLRLPDGGGRADVEVGVATDLLAILRCGRAAQGADRRLAAAVSEAVATSVAVAAEVQENYANARALDELLPILRESAAGNQRLRELARSRLRFGEASRFELTALDARAVELEVELTERERESRDERLELARRLGRPSSAALWTLDTLADPNATTGDEARWVRLALERRAEIQACHWRLSALGVDAQSGSGSAWQDFEVGVRAERGETWSAGPGVSTRLPLFDDGSARRDRAEALVLEARNELTLVQRRVVEEVRHAFAALEPAVSNIARVRDELIPLQLSRRDQVEAARRAGIVDGGAVLLAEQDLRAAQALLVEARRRAFVALVRLERAVGGAGIAKELRGTEEER